MSKHPLTADLNVTPFLDILLVMIITFLAAMQVRTTMDAQLPVPCVGACSASTEPIVLEVRGDGSYLLNRQSVPPADLLATLHRAYDRRPERIIHVAGHRTARYESVLAAMDVARSAGVQVISIPPSSTDP